MNEKLDTLSLKTWRSFITVHANILKLIEKELELAENIPVIEYDVLLTLWETEGHKLRIHELADRVILSRSGLSRLVDRLEKQGLLERDRSCADRRGTYVVLTESGVEAMRRAWPVYASGIKKYFATYLSEAEKIWLVSILERIENGNTA